MKFVEMLISMASPTHDYVPGDIVKVSDEAAEAWIGANYAKLYEENPVKVKDLDKDNDDAEAPEGIEVVSKGLYKLPNGELVKGKKAAEEAYAVYAASLIEQEGDADANQGDNTADDGADSAGTSEGSPEN